jgi:betaine reductase complex component B subunit alpha
MKLDIANFHVNEIQFGEKTTYTKGLLTINKKEALDVVFEDEHITEAELHIVNPGDHVRIVPVKEAVEPRYRVGGGPVFPGVTGKLMQAGDGVTHALKE